MSLKAEIEAWVSALEAYEAQDFDKALSCFDAIADSSKILFNIGLIHATQGAHEQAVRIYRDATSLDPHLAIAFFQSGVSNFLLGRYRDAYADFDEAHQHMRENNTIDYEQLGLKFRLYSCEILFNRGLSMIYSGQSESGMADLARARGEKQTDEHGVIDEAFVDRGNGYTVFSIPVGVLYRPSEVKVKNIKARNYLGKAKLVAATEERDAFTGFTGSTRQALDRIGPVSTGPSRPLPADDNVMTRSASASAVDHTLTGAAALRRRPTDTSASITLANGSGSRSPAAPVRPELGRSNTIGSTRGAVTTTPLLRSASARGLGSGAAYGAKGLPTPPQSVEASPTQQSPRSSSLQSGAQTPPPRSPALASPAGSPRHNLPPRPTRDTDYIIDDVYDDYSRIDELLGNATKEEQIKTNPVVAAWAKTNARPSVRSGSVRRPPLSTGVPSRKGTLRSPLRTGRYTPSSRYPDEEEGYGSGEYDDTLYEVSKIRVKLHYENDVRGMSITPDITHGEFVDKVEAKFARGNFKLRFKDEDGAVISLVDDSDWESAIDAARESANGRPEGKLEIYVD